MSAVEGGRFYREKGYCAISREANCGLSREDWRAWEHRVPASVAGMHAAREILLLPENAAENARIALKLRIFYPSSTVLPSPPAAVAD